MGIGDSKGLTLVELLVVLALMAAISIIAIPAITSQMNHLRLTRSVREVSVELQAARLKAISMNTRYRVSFTLNAGSTPDNYQLYFYNTTTGNWENDTSRTLRSLEQGVNISSPGASFTTDFYPNGTATASSICIENTATAGDRMKITVQSSTGMITVSTGC